MIRAEAPRASGAPVPDDSLTRRTPQERDAYIQGLRAGVSMLVQTIHRRHGGAPEPDLSLCAEQTNVIIDDIELSDG